MFLQEGLNKKKCLGSLNDGNFQDEKKEYLNDYLEKFDVVVMGDGDFFLLDRILRFVASIDENQFFKEKILNNQLFESIERLFQ